eukprot:TRINITY_DN3223_c0_g1_i2.p1 TRINITY_DN3223_c0_g1~~TRINITY_DN3223_c0_g1_i2.p1  ORF type:complete len:702 (-),score=183.93 TRINITY_DN3223_c0_g1_i2:105-2210(-)
MLPLLLDGTACDGTAAAAATAAVAAGTQAQELAGPWAVDGDVTASEDRIDAGVDDAGEHFPVVLYNPLAWDRRQAVSVLVRQPSVTVVDAEGRGVPSQVVPLWDLSVATEEDRHEVDRYRLYFVAEVPALGAATYFVRYADHAAPFAAEYSSYTIYYRKWVGKDVMEQDAVLESAEYRVTISHVNGLIASIANTDVEHEVKLNQKIMSYQSSRSGAYIFHPALAVPDLLEPSTTRLHVVRGSLLDEAQVFMYDSNGALQFQQTVRVWHTDADQTRREDDTEGSCVEDHVEVSNVAIAQPNRELISRFDTDMTTGNRFYTDNGMELMQREVKSGSPAQNYYPVVTEARLKDTSAGFNLVLLPSHSMGFGSTKDRSIEYMMHRNLRNDDGRGMGEGNNDNDLGEVRVWMTVGDRADLGLTAKRLSLFLNNPLELYLHGPVPRPDAFALRRPFAPLSAPLPRDVHLLSLKPHGSSDDGSSALLRLQHIDAAGVPSVVHIGSLFADAEVVHIQRRTLSAAQEYGVMSENRLLWKETGDVIALPQPNYPRSNVALKLPPASADAAVLAPLSIHTYVVSLRLSCGAHAAAAVEEPLQRPRERAQENGLPPTLYPDEPRPGEKDAADIDADLGNRLVPQRPKTREVPPPMPAHQPQTEAVTAFPTDAPPPLPLKRIAVYVCAGFALGALLVGYRRLNAFLQSRKLRTN